MIFMYYLVRPAAFAFISLIGLAPFGQRVSRIEQKSDDLATQKRDGGVIPVRVHLQNGEEFALATHALIDRGSRIFCRAWTVHEGGGRPFSKGTGRSFADPLRSLVGAPSSNR